MEPAVADPAAGRAAGVLGAIVSARTWLAVVYLVTGLPLTSVAALTLVTGLAVSVALLPIAFLGVPLAAVTLAAMDVVCRVERARTAVLVGVDIAAPPPKRVTNVRWWWPRWRVLLGPQRWLQAGAVVLLVPGHLAGFAAVTVVWPAALTLVTLPAYVVAGGTVVVGDGEVTGVPALIGCAIGGFALLLAAPQVTRATAAALAAASRMLLGPSRLQALAARVGELEQSRAAVTGAAEVERRRIERDLHDGAQQRLVAMMMELARAKARLSADDPESARILVDQAHDQARTALAELRNLVRGVHPPVLSDRGLDAALSGLAALCPVPVDLDVRLGTRPSTTVESIAYFVVAEALTNVAKHAHATSVRVTVAQPGDRLVVSIHDDGIGGADPAGTGLTGMAGRVAAVDGHLSIESPPGGPTALIVELPCAL
jgi:signal transduction histidine kinase